MTRAVQYTAIRTLRVAGVSTVAVPSGGVENWRAEERALQVRGKSGFAALNCIWHSPALCDTQHKTTTTTTLHAGDDLVSNSNDPDQLADLDSAPLSPFVYTHSLVLLCKDAIVTHVEYSKMTL